MLKLECTCHEHTLAVDYYDEDEVEFPLLCIDIHDELWQPTLRERINRVWQALTRKYVREVSGVILDAAGIAELTAYLDEYRKGP